MCIHIHMYISLTQTNTQHILILNMQLFLKRQFIAKKYYMSKSLTISMKNNGENICLDIIFFRFIYNTI